MYQHNYNGIEEDENKVDGSDDDWVEGPVSPSYGNPYMSQFSSHYSPYFRNYKTYDPQDRLAKYRFEDYPNNKHKRFMVSKKRNDPTRELRYLNGAHDRDLYSLSQMFGVNPKQNNNYYHRMNI